LDSTVNFSWGNGSPDSSVPVDNFSARWSGTFTPDLTQTYTFYTQSDDGVRLWLGNNLIINDWNTHGTKENSATVTLTAGQAYALKLEYFDATGGATVKVLMSSPQFGKTIIPTAFLRP
jgi:hypothetical protein